MFREFGNSVQRNACFHSKLCARREWSSHHL
jgi:hypothetical protein